MAAQSWKERQEGWALDQARAQGVGDGYMAGAGRLHESWNTEYGLRPEFQRVAKAVVHPPQDDIDWLEAFEGLQADP